MIPTEFYAILEGRTMSRVMNDFPGTVETIQARDMALDIRYRT